MAGKKRKDRSQGAGSADVKRLRRKLRKAEAGLEAAQEKQERAGARVAAMSIIVEEMRATLATVEQAAAREADSPLEPQAPIAARSTTAEPAVPKVAKVPTAPKPPSAPKPPRRAATSSAVDPASRRAGPATRRRPSPPAHPA